MTTAPSTPLAARLRGATRRFGAAPVLRGVDLDVARGECVALFGANGAGKSTLLRVLAGLLRADAGSVEVLGRELPGDAGLRRRIGYLGHDPFLYRDLDARENLAFYARLFGVRDASRADALIAAVGLERAAERRVGTYSRGMLQRLGLARALLHEPELLLLDEPLTGLDPEGAALLTRTLLDTCARGATVVMATHDVERALDSAGRAVILSRGRVAWDSARTGVSLDVAVVTAGYVEVAASA